ncbi:MAG: hypothetical protein HDT38_01635 [Clostridiales bacterium]|nr:hypothetical protein [Clostridiales bacterium]
MMVLTQEYLGLNGTFSNILSMLSLAELGIGTAITYSLYRPLAQHDEEQIAALMRLYRRVYEIIGLVVALLGFALAPFLPILIRDLPDIPHIYLIYLLFVLNSSLSYFFVYKQSLIIADQRQYIVTICNALFNILLCTVRAVFLWITGNYFVYLGLQIGLALVENLTLSYIADRLYPYVNAKPYGKLDPNTKKEIVKNTKGMIIHKASSVVVFSTDNLLISSFVGVVEVGLYSNYLMITQALSSVYLPLFNSLLASIGNLGVTADSRQVLSVFNRLNFVGNWLYGFSAVCLAILMNPFIELWLGADYLFSPAIVGLIALNFYVTGMRQAVGVFCSAEGLYWYGRRKAVVESIINLVASVVLAVPYGIAGIFLGTFISTMTTCFWVEPLILFEHGLRASAKPYFRDYAINTLVTLLTVVAIWYISAVLPGKGLVLFVEKMAVCVVVGNIGYLLINCRREEFHYFVELLKKLLRRQKV